MGLIRFGLMIVSCVSALMSSSCGRAPLNEEQKSSFSAAISTANDGLMIATQTASDLAAGNFDIDPARAGEFKAKLKEKAKKSCKFKYKSSNGQIEAEISGKDCPIEFSLSVTGTSSASITFALHYLVKDPELAALHDLTSYDLTMKAAAQVNGNSANVGVDGKGEIQTQKHGRISLAINGSVTVTVDPSTGKTTSNGVVTYLYKFEKFEAEIKAEFIDTRIKYTLNGQEITAEEAARYLVGNPSTSPVSTENFFPRLRW